MEGRDFLIFNNTRQVVWVFMSRRPGNDHSGSVEQRQNELPYGYIKAKRGFLQNGMMLIKTQICSHPANAIEKRIMRIADALWFSCRS